MSEAAEPRATEAPVAVKPLLGIAVVFLENGTFQVGQLDGMQKAASQEDVVALCNLVLLNEQMRVNGATVLQGARGRVLVPTNGGNSGMNRLRALFGKGRG